MELKYKLLKKNFKDILGRRVYQIRALKDFGDIKKGDLGGWIEKESNLSQEGNCWVLGDAKVYDDAKVSEDARVSGHACVSDDARVYGNAQVFGTAQVFGDACVSDDAQVFGNARVFGTAQVFDNAKVSGNAWVHGNARISKSVHIIKTSDYITIGPIGSRNAFLTIIKKDNYVSTGCFSGTKEEFLDQVEKTHGDNEFAKAYQKAITYVFGRKPRTPKIK